MIRSPEDKLITCIDCGEQFVHTYKAQQFFKEKGFSEPKRCKRCKAAKKAQQEARGYAR